MTNPANSAVQNLLPVQAYFDAQNNFVTFIGQGVPFYATVYPDQSGLNITNSTINSTTIGLTTPAAAAFTDVAMTTGTISTQPTAATDIVNLLALQSYAAGISWKQPCAVATLTNITLSGLQTIDTYTTLAGDRVLVKDQGTAANNGIYIASAGPWTRALDANSWDELVCAISFIEYGTQKGGAWFCTAQPGGTLGVTAVNWSQFTTSATYTAGTGLTLTGFEFSITNTGVSASTYGSATATPVFAVNAQGQITSVTNTTITPAIGSVTGLGANVATFLATPTSANLAAAVSDETGSGALVFATSPTLVTPALGTVTSGDFSTGTFTWPTFNQNTTGYAASLAGGAAGSLPYQTALNTTGFLAAGTNGQILTLAGGVPTWATPAASGVTSFSAGTTGFTPNTSTTGAVTLAGTLATTNGGTGLTAFTSGGAVYASTTSVLTTGTLPVTAGGTGVTTSTGTAGSVVLSTNPTLNGLTNTGNLTFTGTGNRITGDFSNATVANRVAFQSSTTNGNTSVGAIPNGTAVASGFRVYGSSDTNNTSFGQLLQNGYSETQLRSDISGTGTYAALTMFTGGSERLRITTNGGVAFGGSTNYGSSGQLLQSNGDAAPSFVAQSTITAGNATNTAITDDTTTASAVYPTWVTTTTGNLPQKTSSTKLSFVPSTGILTATGFAGNATSATNVAGGAANKIVYNTGSGATAFIDAPTTSSTSLTWNGSAFTWASAGGTTISNDTSTNATYYPLFATATSGSLSAAKVSSTKLTYNPSTGALSSTSHVSSSDERLKTNWRSMPVDFVEKLASVKVGIYDRTDVDATQVGVSAQSLQTVLSDAVIEDAEGMLAISYGNAALAATVELAKIVLELKQEIAQLKGK